MSRDPLYDDAFFTRLELLRKDKLIKNNLKLN